MNAEYISSNKVEQQGYRSCMALVKPADKYSVTRVEAACKKVLSYTPYPSFKNVKTILSTGKVNLLFLDECMLVSLTETEARDVLELIHARHKCASTIFCSQFSPAGWHAKIGEATLADVILDRLVHDSYTIEIHDHCSDGQSWRRSSAHYGRCLPIRSQPPCLC